MNNQPAPQPVTLEGPNSESPKKLPFVLLAILIFLLGSASVLVIQSFAQTSTMQNFFNPPGVGKKINFEKFSSLENFKAFLTTVPQTGFMASFGLARTLESAAIPTAELKVADDSVTRISATNVQVKGIDEPDIAKTNGQEIFFLPENFFRPLPLLEPDQMGWPVPNSAQPEISAIRAFPPEQLKLIGQIDQAGEMLLVGQILVIFSQEGIYGYNIANPASPQTAWQVTYQNNHSLTAARLYQNKIYFLTQRQIDRNQPCPIAPLQIKEQKYQVRCTDIYHPTNTVPVDTTYTAFVLDPQSGQISQSLAFVGSTSESVIFMSSQALYVTYSYYQDLANFYYQFLQVNDDLFPQYLISKLAKIKDYDLSNQAKMTEIQSLLAEYFNSLNENEQLRVENEFANRWEDFNQNHLRDLEKTAIVKIGLDQLAVQATGEVPGRPLNQFSLDEYQGYLRLATTLRSGGQMGWGMASANDIYVLDGQLNTVGQIVNLGLTEQIYAARFIADRGYLVTFQKTDPFYVLDFSNPRQPQVKGELKIPGFSSYLHPLAANQILGIGQEGSQVKLSLFDVSRPENPVETDQHILDEYWSEVLNNHHAFLLDSQHQIFFLPANRGGYIFGYRGNKLSLLRTVANLQARRALYINDYLYILGDNQIVVLDENNWEEVNRLNI